MANYKIKKLANILVNYSLNVQKDEIVKIISSPLGIPLVEEVYKKVLTKKAHPIANIEIERLGEILFKKGTNKQIEFVPNSFKSSCEEIDCYLRICAPENIQTLTNCYSKKIGLRRKAQKIYRNKILENTKWCLVNYPTNALAQNAGMSLREYEDFLFKATLIDWPDIHNKQQKIINKFDGSNLVHILGQETDIKFNVKNRTWVNSDGKNNMPSGEVFTSPIADSVNGSIYIDLPTFYQGKKFEGVKLNFKNGVVKEASAKTNGKNLIKILDTDENARRCGELAFGFNYGITKITGDTLFDEKVGGTMHIALGSSYKEAGGKIDSAIHWDMVRTINPGTVLVDGKEFYKEGKWLI